MSSRVFTGIIIILIVSMVLFPAKYEKGLPANISMGTTGTPLLLNTVIPRLYFQHVNKACEKKQLCKQVRLNDPCDAAKAGIDAANHLSGTNHFSAAKHQVQESGIDGHEHSITFGRDSIDGINTSPVTDGDVTKGKVNSNWPGAFADIHNHFNDQPPSAGDLYYLIKVNSNHKQYNTRFVMTLGGTLYAIYIYDLGQAKNFAEKYPLEQSPGFSPRFPEPVFDDMDRITIYFQGEGVSPLIARERAMAFILERYNSGVALLKQDSIGNFKKLQTEEAISGGMKIYIASNCD